MSQQDNPHDGDHPFLDLEDPADEDSDEPEDLPSLAEDDSPEDSSVSLFSGTLPTGRTTRTGTSRFGFKTPPVRTRPSLARPKPKTGSAPPKILWSSISSSKSSIPTPQCGGLYKDNADAITAFVGTNPDVNIFSWDASLKDWVCLGDYLPGKPNNQGPIHQGQFRPTNLKLSAAIEKACVTHSGPKYNGLTALEGESLIAVRTFKATCKQHMLLHGMWDVFNLPDPISGGNQDLFERHGRFTLEHVLAHVQTRRSQADKYELENFKWSGQYLFNALSPQLLAKVIEEVGIDASGPEVLSGIFVVMYKGDGFDALERVRTMVTGLKITGFAGQNVEDYVKKVKDGCERLDSANMMKPGDDILLKIVRNLECTTVLTFQVEMGLLYKKVDKWVQACRVLDPDVAATKVTKWDYEKVCDACVKEYRDLVAGERWTAQANKKPSEPQLPAGFLAQMQSAMVASLQQQGFAQTKNGGGSGSGGGGRNSHQTANGAKTCAYCKETGHLIADCPKLKAKKEREAGGGNSNPSASQGKDKSGGNDPWKTVLPKGANPDTCTKEVRGRTWKWCSKCNNGKGRFMFHHAAGHDAWAARKAAREQQGTGTGGSNGGNHVPPKHPTANLAQDGSGSNPFSLSPHTSFWFDRD